MILSTFPIHFEFHIRDTSFNIPLTAEVELHHTQTHYMVRNFKISPSNRRPLLPEICIRKDRGKWVHCDSTKETELSVAIGKAIEEYAAEQE